jgi:hypothetical protein
MQKLTIKPLNNKTPATPDHIIYFINKYIDIRLLETGSLRRVEVVQPEFPSERMLSIVNDENRYSRSSSGTLLLDTPAWPWCNLLFLSSRQSPGEEHNVHCSSSEREN